MSILATNTKLVKVGQEYSAGSGISIDDYVISVTASLTGDYASQSAFDELSDSFSSLSSNINSNSGTWNDTSDVVKESSASWNQGKTYEGISPIVVNNDENKVSADTWTFSAGSNVSFVDDNVNKITRIDCTVTGEGGDPQVNSFVYDNSATILDVDSSYQSNSGTFLTAHQDISNKLDTTAFSTVSGDFLTAIPSQYATTGDVAELAQTISETYQTKGDYLVRSDSANFYPMDGNPSGFLTAHQSLDGLMSASLLEYSGSVITAYNGHKFAGEISGDQADAQVNEWVYNNSGKCEESNNVVETNSGNWNDKLDTTSFSDVSGTFLTAHQSLEGLMSASLLESADGKWTAYNSIPFKAGDEFPASADEAIQAYQTNSGLYLTAHQDISNKLDVSAFSDVSGTFLTAVDLTPYYTTADANTLSSMLSGAIDYVSANIGGGTTYTSPNGTILINDDTLEASTSGFGTSVKIVNVETVNSYFSAIPGYPFYTYSAQSTDLMNYLTLRYGDWSDGLTVSNVMTANIVEIPLTSGGYDLWMFNGSHVRVSAVKSGVVELAKKDDLFDYTTTAERNELSASISSVNSNLYELSGKTISGSKLGTIVVEGQNIEASTSAVTQVADTTATTNSQTVSVTSMPNYPYDAYKFSFGQYTFSVQAIYGNNWNERLKFNYNQDGVTIPATYNGYDLTMVGYGEGVLSGIKSSVVELALKSDLPTYEYDSTNKISAINGSALAGGQGGVPQSAFDELKQSYDALSSLFATYSGQWLLPNGGI